MCVLEGFGFDQFWHILFSLSVWILFKVFTVQLHFIFGFEQSHKVRLKHFVARPASPKYLLKSLFNLRSCN